MVDSHTLLGFGEPQNGKTCSWESIMAELPQQCCASTTGTVQKVMKVAQRLSGPWSWPSTPASTQLYVLLQNDHALLLLVHLLGRASTALQPGKFGGDLTTFVPTLPMIRGELMCHELSSRPWATTQLIKRRTHEYSSSPTTQLMSSRLPHYSRVLMYPSNSWNRMSICACG